MSEFDAIVVGSGITGGWAAKELSEKGLKVLLLERGRNVVHGKDYVGEHKSPWEFAFRNFGDRKRYAQEYPIQGLCFALQEASEQFFVNDKEHPYQSGEEDFFAWIRGYHLGGRSLTWGRVSLRISDLNFAESKSDGTGIDWPIRYGDLAPWYDHVEKFIGVSGQKEGRDTLPDGAFLPPLKMNPVEEHVRSAIAQHFEGRIMTTERCAVLSEPHNGRAACHYCGPCHRGCSTGSYFSTLSSTLPAALATGNLTVKTDTIVAGLEYDATLKRATGVRTIDAKTHEHRTYSARLIMLNASTLGTTQILLNSKSAAFPRGFANSSGVLGHYLMDHVIGPSVIGTMPGFEDLQPYGVRPNGVYIPRFRNLKERDAPFIRGYGYQGVARRETWTRGTELPEMGTALKAKLRTPGPWQMMIGGMGECLPYRHNQALLDDTKLDQWGIPQLRISFRWGDNEKAMAQDMAAEGEAMLRSAGAVNIQASAVIASGGMAVHEMGTARMGHDPATSVLNHRNQCHDVPNVFVTDGACMTSSPCQNPSLTYMALTARACDFAAAALKSHTL